VIPTPYATLPHLMEAEGEIYIISPKVKIAWNRIAKITRQVISVVKRKGFKGGLRSRQIERACGCP
jgi:hypothetical protein